MNSYTRKDMFLEDPITILRDSEILDREMCVIAAGVVYEKIGRNEWRFFFSCDDYDYLEENDALVKKLEAWLEEGI